MAGTGGRPPGPTDETRERVLQAAFRLLVSEGSGELTAVRLHRETGVARTTIYRHWPTPAHIVGDILAGAIARHELDDLVGRLTDDLPVAVATLTFRFEHRPVADLFRATLHHRDDETPTLGQRYVGGLVAPVEDVLAAAIDRGEIEAQRGVEPRSQAKALTSELCGPLLLDHLLLGRPVDHEVVAARTEAFLARHRVGPGAA
ncbi:MAG: TetR/AcrR family transcriptional regulator [Actinomycetota bacterium]